MRAALTALIVATALAACSGSGDAGPPPATPVPTPSAAAEPAGDAPPSASANPAAESPPALPAAEPPPEPTRTPGVEPTNTASRPISATSGSPAIPARIEVAATRDGLTRIGAGKCKMCHKVQYQSWSEGPHAELEPPLDCESCHGPGSEYKTLAVMKDPVQAAAAGLVTPDAAFCTDNCHTDGWQDEMLTRSHAHKQDG